MEEAARNFCEGSRVLFEKRSPSLLDSTSITRDGVAAIFSRNSNGLGLHLFTVAPFEFGLNNISLAIVIDGYLRSVMISDSPASANICTRRNELNIIENFDLARYGMFFRGLCKFQNMWSSWKICRVTLEVKLKKHEGW